MIIYNINFNVELYYNDKIKLRFFFLYQNVKMIIVFNYYIF